MPGCSVFGCFINGRKSKKDCISFHRFPREIKLRQKWIAACGVINESTIDSARVCSFHFRDEDYERDLKAELLNSTPRKTLKATAIPTLRLPSQDRTVENVSCIPTDNEPPSKHSFVKPSTYNKIENSLIKSEGSKTNQDSMQKEIHSLKENNLHLRKKYLILTERVKSVEAENRFLKIKLAKHESLCSKSQQKDMDWIDTNPDIEESDLAVQHNTEFSTVPTRPTTSKKSTDQNYFYTKPKRQKILHDLMEVACDVLARPEQPVIPNRFLHMASNVAAILEELNNSDPTQCLLAEKLVNDVLFQGRLGYLNFDTCLSEATENN